MAQLLSGERVKLIGKVALNSLNIVIDFPVIIGMSSSVENLYEDEVCLIQYDKGRAVLQLAFLQHPTPDQFKNGYRIAFAAAELKNARYWLTNAQKIKAMVPENQSWLVQKMAPFLGAQIKRFAIVMAPECFVMTNPNKVYEKPKEESASPSGGLIKVHFEEEAAFSWLLSEELAN